jgi:hypothetical protein
MTDALLLVIVFLLCINIVLSMRNSDMLRRLLSDFATMVGDAIDELMREE